MPSGRHRLSAKIVKNRRLCYCPPNAVLAWPRKATDVETAWAMLARGIAGWKSREGASGGNNGDNARCDTWGAQDSRGNTIWPARLVPPAENPASLMNALTVSLLLLRKPS